MALRDPEFTNHPVLPPLITGTFGEMYGERIHLGVDYGAPLGTLASNRFLGDAQCVDFTNDGSFGIGVCIDYKATPYYGLYAHLSEAMVKPGDKVIHGQVIGKTGNTGASTGPHLHWQLCKLPTFPRDPTLNVDPLPFVKVKSDVPTHRMKVTATGVRMRSGPGTMYPILRTTKADEVLQVSELGWVRVTDGSGLVGWVRGDYLDHEGYR
jgi:hypothetical protein